MKNIRRTATTLISVLLITTTTAIAQTSNEGSSPDAASPLAPGENATPDGAGTSFGGYIIEPSKSQTTASSYIGMPIYSSDDQRIGEVKDLIVEKDGGIVAAVVGVGGFVGVAEKVVALRMDRIERAPYSDDGQMRLVTKAKMESVTSAPEFRTSDRP